MNECLNVKNVMQQMENNINKEAMQKRPIVVDADYYKQIYNDYENTNHPIYGLMAKDLLFKALKLPEIKKVVFTAGGSGSGKSEVICRHLIQESFQGIIVDGTLANYTDAIDNITRSLDAGKQVEIRGIVTELERAYNFVLQREIRTGRGVPIDTFIERHFNFIDSFPKLMQYFKNNPNINFILYDNRSLDTLKIETSKQQILDLFNSLRRNKDIIKTKLQSL